MDSIIRAKQSKTFPSKIIGSSLPSRSSEVSIRLYVGNLSYQTTQEDLSQTFAEAGNVTNATVMTDRYSGQSRGFGFVEMATDDEAQKAITMFNGFTLGGRPLVVNEARPREQGGGGSFGGRPSGGGNYGGGGGGNYGGGGGGNYGGGGGGNYGGGRGGNRGDGRDERSDRYERDRY
jgi:RNA recognition motif-containing protein